MGLWTIKNEAALLAESLSPIFSGEVSCCCFLFILILPVTKTESLILLKENIDTIERLGTNWKIENYRYIAE